VGDVDTEVIQQACEQNPQLCVNDNGEHGRQLIRTSLKTRVLQWMNAIRGKKERNEVQFVEEAEQRRRSEICAGCGNNEGVSESCGSCKAAIKEMQRVILGGKFVDGRLKACKALGEQLAVSTHLEEQALDDASLPGHCWRKRSV
jgi:hypothetical protein